MALLRFDPFREFDRLAQEAFPGRPTIPMDAVRHGDHVLVQFDLPGVDPDAIELTVEKNELTVEVTRTWEPGEDVDVLAAERPRGTFRRRLMLGDNLDADHLEADYDHGVLTLRIPVAEAAKPRKITVGASTPALSS